jgi:putative endonuclease
MAFVYIIASKKNGTIYIGVTSNIIKRVYEHKQYFVDGFTKKYNIKDLVYYEQHESIADAIYR